MQNRIRPRGRTLAALVLALVASTSSARAQSPLGPPENPVTPAKVVLGKILFWEEQLSSDDTVACGTCHRPEQGGVDPRVALHPSLDGLFGTPDDVRGSPGVIHSDSDNAYEPSALFGLNRQVTGRRAPTFIDVAAAPELFWDGRASSTFVDPETGAVSIAVGGALESQAAGPPVSDVEMAHAARDWSEITAKLITATPMKLAGSLTPDIAAALAASPTYPDLFDAAFGSPDITAERIAFAIASYERILIPNQTPFDAFMGGMTAALTPAQQAGLAIFNGPGRCNLCHTGPDLSDHGFHNLGNRPIAEDAGRQDVTGDPADAGRFKTPPLRNVGLRNRFMHNGGLPSLTLLVNFYNGGGGVFPANKDPLLIPLGLSPLQRTQLVDFLQNALTDPRVAAALPPFDRPTLHSEVVPANPILFGTASSGTGGLIPQMIAVSPPHINAVDWKMGVGQALGGAQAYLAMAFAAAPPGLTLAGIPINISPDPTSLVIAPVALDGTPGVAGAGYATVQVPIADNPALAGLELFLQWFVVDPSATGGAAASRGTRLTFF